MKRETFPAEFLSRFTPTEIPETAAEPLLNIAQESANNAGYWHDTVLSMNAMTTHPEGPFGEEAKHSNDCFAVRAVGTSIRAIQNPF
jgi:hypothetical protein